MTWTPEQSYEEAWNSVVSYLNTHYAEKLDELHRWGYTLDPDSDSLDTAYFIYHDPISYMEEAGKSKRPVSRIAVPLGVAKNILGFEKYSDTVMGFATYRAEQKSLGNNVEKEI